MGNSVKFIINCCFPDVAVEEVFFQASKVPARPEPCPCPDCGQKDCLCYGVSSLYRRGWRQETEYQRRRMRLRDEDE